MATLSAEQVAKYLYDAGFRGEDLVKMTAIAKRESGYDPAAHRSDQPKEKLSGDMGLFQINYTNWSKIQAALGLTSKSQLFDPAINARAAKVLYDGGGLSPWSMGPGGWTKGGDPLYGTNVTTARTAVNKFLGNPGAYSASTGSTSTGQTTPRAQLEYKESNVAEPKRSYTIDDWVAPTADPEQQKTLTNLLKGFGVEYPNAPRATPQLLAYMRGMGMTVDTAEDQFNTTRENLQRRAADSAGDLAVSDQRRRRGIATSAQSRGALVSGATNTDYAEQAEDLARSQADVERGLAEGISQADMNLQTIKDSARQQALEQTIGEETSQKTEDARNKAETEAAQKALEEADLAYERQRSAEERAAQRAIDMYNAR